MATNIGTFDMKKVKFTFGTETLSGYSDGEAIEIEESVATFETKVGADGHTDRVKKGSNYLIITVKLMQTSPVNDILSQLHVADKLGNITLPLLIKDKSGSSICSATNAWITSFSKTSYGDSTNERVWTINTSSNYLHFIGGNK